MAVIVPEDGECASACVFLYVRGVLRGHKGACTIRVYLTVRPGRPGVGRRNGSSLQSVGRYGATYEKSMSATLSSTA